MPRPHAAFAAQRLNAHFVRPSPGLWKAWRRHPVACSAGVDRLTSFGWCADGGGKNLGATHVGLPVTWKERWEAPLDVGRVATGAFHACTHDTTHLGVVAESKGGMACLFRAHGEVGGISRAQGQDSSEGRSFALLVVEVAGAFGRARGAARQQDVCRSDGLARSMLVQEAVRRVAATGRTSPTATSRGHRMLGKRNT